MPVSFEAADRRAGDVLARLSSEEKLQLISGHNFYFIKGFPEHDMPELYLADATQGVHIRANLPGQLARSTSFPCAINLAATWNPELAERYALAVGEECRAGGVAVLLGPGMNIYRVAQCGRNFEYCGEDPFLAARMIERYVGGVLATGTMPTLKHFLANNSDWHRRTSNSIIDERTLHEIYLPAFQAGIDAGAPAVMTSYNQLNGEWTGQSHYVITGLLRGEMGFKGLVMSDWWSVWDAEKIIASGQDLEMPGDKFIKTDGARLLREGRVTEAQIDRMARSIIRTCIAMGFYDRPVRDESLLAKFPEHAQVALQTAREGIVLLKNDGILPLRADERGEILLTGMFVEELARGGGAADVLGYDIVTLLQALRDVFGARIDYVKEPSDAQLESAAVVLISTGTRDHEGWDRPFALPEADEAQVVRAVSLNPRTVVLVNSGGGIRMTGWNDRAAAVVYAWYPGQIGNRALAEILSGASNPSGKLPMTIEQRFEDSPGFGYLPPGAEFYSGWKADNDMTQPVHDINYREGVFVGYRWYESKQIAPLYAFGHGLSYTTFDYRDLKLSSKTAAVGSAVDVEFTVTNTGARAGAEIAQLYVRDVEASVPRPPKELKGFSRVELQPGESRVVRLQLRARDFAFWDVAQHGWKTEAGEFRVLVGGASNRTPLEATIVLE